ncbi:MAG TPA: AAA family ATPase [Solirubrobacteraceae bacterium]
MELPAALADHPHARAVLGPAWPPAGGASHAYLFHGPPGTGKRTVARAFAAALLADGAPHPDAAAARAERGTHPDLTWVTPSGAAEMLVGDIDHAVVAAATRTPFESQRRVFVLQDAHTLNDQAANRLLKTLEEPPSFVHLILLAPRRDDVLATIASRCQPVRFDPLPPARGYAQLLARPREQALCEHARRFVADALQGATAQRAWLGLLADAKAAGAAAGEDVQERLAHEAELLPAKERRRHERDGADARRRAERRARTAALDLALHFAELWLRDVWCTAEGAPDLVHAADAGETLRGLAAGRSGAALRRGVQLVADTRLRLPLNVSEELAFEALAYRLHDLA